MQVGSKVQKGEETAVNLKTPKAVGKDKSKVNPKSKIPTTKVKQQKKEEKDIFASTRKILSKINQYQEETNKELKILSGLRKAATRKVKDAYPSLYELESVTSNTKVCSKYNKTSQKPANKDCSFCTSKQRNKCWREAVKVDRLKHLVKGIPFLRENLAELKFKDLILLCSYFHINTWALPSKNRGELVVAILAKQRELK